LKVKEYETFVADHAFIKLDNEAYSVVGLCGEAGEIAEWYKKAVFRGNPKYTDEMLKSELGDVLHYTTRLALRHGWTLKEVMQGNIDKLNQRSKNVT